MNKERKFQAAINPLLFQFFDEASPVPSTYDYIRSEEVLDYLCKPELNFNKDILINRYRDIIKEAKQLIAIPAEKNILDKLIWPLKRALVSYMTGNCLGTIALCGMVAEMSAILLFEICEFRLNDKVMDEEMQKKIFGFTFERLGQERRINILQAYSLIDEKTKKAFDDIRTIRRNYLHFYSKEISNIESDAKKAFHATTDIVITIIGQDIDNGRIVLNPVLVKYLEKKGIIEI
jgi:hypothetical protein